MSPEDVVDEFGLDGTDAQIVRNILSEDTDRPDRLHGRTERVQTGYGKMYVTINEHNGRPHEIAINIGRSGGQIKGFTETIAKLSTMLLRNGVPADVVADKLKGIRSPKIAYDNERKIKSIPDAVGVVIERHIDNKNPGGTVRQTAEQNNDSISIENASVCPECGDKALLEAEGCDKCESCGHSEC